MKKFAFLISLLVVFLTGCNLSNQKLAKKMLISSCKKAKESK